MTGAELVTAWLAKCNTVVTSEAQRVLAEMIDVRAAEAYYEIRRINDRLAEL